MFSSTTPRSDDQLPRYLLPMLEPRPSAEAKLLAVWDGLSVEHQVLVLERLGRRGNLYWTNRIRGKALDCLNAYVRYLAARGFNPDDDPEQAALKRRIDADPEPLVRYAPLESEWGLLDQEYYQKPERFFALPHEARLAIVRSLCAMGQDVAELIRYALANEVPNHRVTASELGDLLLDYVTNPQFRLHYDPENEMNDGWAEHGRGKDIEALWALVPDVPEATSYVLISNLPERGSIGSSIPDNVIDGMSRPQIELLLERQDIGLQELRRKIFLEGMRAHDEMDDATSSLRVRAISCNLRLSHAEFAEVLLADEKKKADILKDLAQYALDLSLSSFQAANDILRDTDWSDDTDPLQRLWEVTIGVSERFAARVARLPANRREWETQEWRLYELAKEAMPWKSSEKRHAPSGEFAFLAGSVKDDDTWGTFMAFCQAWDKRRWDNEGLAEALRRSFPLPEEQDAVDDEDFANDAS